MDQPWKGESLCRPSRASLCLGRTPTQGLTPLAIIYRPCGARTGACAGSNTLPKLEKLLQHLSEVMHVHVAFAADEHQRPVVAKVAVPFHDFLVTPFGVVLRQFLLRNARDVG